MHACMQVHTLIMHPPYIHTHHTYMTHACIRGVHTYIMHTLYTYIARTHAPARAHTHTHMTGVISALATKQKHVPFRDSKLTYLLSSSLRLYICMHACMHAGRQAWVCIRALPELEARPYTCTCIHTNMHTWSWICSFYATILRYQRVHVPVNRARAHTHTHTHTHTQWGRQGADVCQRVAATWACVGDHQYPPLRSGALM